MTWGARIISAHHPRDHKINEPYNVCGQCKHGGTEVEGQPYRNGHAVCNVQAAAATLGQLLTVIDVGADSHMASGQLVLECNGFEAKEPQS